MTDFNTDLITGKNGEKKLAAALTMKGHTVTDVSDVYEYRRRDIDFIVSRKDSVTTLEVKNDVRSNTTGNVFIETYCQENTSRNGAGWYYYCEAEYIAFIQEQKNVAHIISRSDLMKLIENNTYRILNKWDYSSSGYIVPITHIKKCDSYVAIELIPKTYEW